MNFKTTGILALVLLIGIAAVVLLDKQDKKKESADKIEGKLLNINKENIAEIILEPSGIHCRKDSAGWKIVAPLQTDADNSAIDGLTSLFGWANIERTISSDPAEYAAYGLAPELGKMILAHGDTLDTLYVGDKSPTGSYVFARKSGSPDVFLTTTSLQTNVEKTLFDLRDKKVLGFEKNDVRSFTLKNEHGNFALGNDSGAWQLTSPAEYTADASEVDQVLNRLNSERAKEFVDEAPADLKQYGLVGPAVQIDLLLGADLAKKTLLIGKRDGDKFYAKDESRQPVFLVDSSFVTVLSPDLFKLRNKDLADFTGTDVTKFELEFSGQTIVCTKDTSDIWMVEQPEPRKAKSWQMSSITREASQLKVVKFVDDHPRSLGAYGLAAPQVRAKFYQQEKLVLDVSLGKTEGEEVYAKLADSESVYLVAKNVLETWTPTLDEIAEAQEALPEAGAESTASDQ